MTHYYYKAINAAGEICSGYANAENKMQLAAKLQRSQLEPVNIRIDWKRLGLFKGPATRHAILIHFFFSLEQFSRAGVPILDALKELESSMHERQFLSVIASLRLAIENGLRLSQAMAHHPTSFNTVLTGLIQAGEESGNLDSMFEHITAMLRWQDELNRQSRSMLLYPAMAAVAVLCVTAFLLLYLVPQLGNFIRSFGEALPLHTRLLLAASEGLRSHGITLALTSFFVCVTWLVSLQTHRKFREWHEQLIWNLPITGTIARNLLLARLTNTFAIMYGSGIAIPACISTLRQLTSNVIVQTDLSNTLLRIESGSSLAQSVQNSKIFPLTAQRLIRMGEATGRLEAALRSVAYLSENTARDAIKKLQIMAEPCITLILGLLLGWVMLSVFSPLYALIGKMGMS